MGFFDRFDDRVSKTKFRNVKRIIEIRDVFQQFI